MASSLLVYPPSLDLPAVTNYLAEAQEALVKKMDSATLQLNELLQQAGWKTSTIALKQLTSNQDRDKTSKSAILRMQEPYEFLTTHFT